MSVHEILMLGTLEVTSGLATARWSRDKWLPNLEVDLPAVPATWGRGHLGETLALKASHEAGFFIPGCPCTTQRKQKRILESNFRMEQ